MTVSSRWAWHDARSLRLCGFGAGLIVLLGCNPSKTPNVEPHGGLPANEPSMTHFGAASVVAAPSLKASRLPFCSPIGAPFYVESRAPTCVSGRFDPEISGLGYEQWPELECPSSAGLGDEAFWSPLANLVGVRVSNGIVLVQDGRIDGQISNCRLFALGSKSKSYACALGNRVRVVEGAIDREFTFNAPTERLLAHGDGYVVATRNELRWIRASASDSNPIALQGSFVWVQSDGVQGHTVALDTDCQLHLIEGEPPSASFTFDLRDVVSSRNRACDSTTVRPMFAVSPANRVALLTEFGVVHFRRGASTAVEISSPSEFGVRAFGSTTFLTSEGQLTDSRFREDTGHQEWHSRSVFQTGRTRSWVTDRERIGRVLSMSPDGTQSLAQIQRREDGWQLGYHALIRNATGDAVWSDAADRERTDVPWPNATAVLRASLDRSVMSIQRHRDLCWVITNGVSGCYRYPAAIRSVAFGPRGAALVVETKGGPWLIDGTTGRVSFLARNRGLEHWVGLESWGGFAAIRPESGAVLVRPENNWSTQPLVSGDSCALLASLGTHGLVCSTRRGTLLLWENPTQAPRKIDEVRGATRLAAGRDGKSVGLSSETESRYWRVEGGRFAATYPTSQHDLSLLWENGADLWLSARDGKWQLGADEYHLGPHRIPTASLVNLPDSVTDGIGRIEQESEVRLTVGGHLCRIDTLLPRSGGTGWLRIVVEDGRFEEFGQTALRGPSGCVGRSDQSPGRLCQRSTTPHLLQELQRHHGVPSGTRFEPLPFQADALVGDDCMLTLSSTTRCVLPNEEWPTPYATLTRWQGISIGVDKLDQAWLVQCNNPKRQFCSGSLPRRITEHSDWVEAKISHGMVLLRSRSGRVASASHGESTTWQNLEAALASRKDLPGLPSVRSMYLHHSPLLATEQGVHGLGAPIVHWPDLVKAQEAFGGLCALNGSGNVYCMGASFGQRQYFDALPRKLAIPKIVALSTGSRWVSLLADDGHLWVVPSGEFETLGTPQAQLVADLPPIVEIDGDLIRTQDGKVLRVYSSGQE